MNSGNGHRAGIAKIQVSGLFGHFDYDLEAPGGADSELARILILYGGNGSGKTTILNCLYHMLSSETVAGHRTALAETPFSRLVVEFRDGRMVSADRTTLEKPSIVGPFNFRVSDPSGGTREGVFTNSELRRKRRELVHGDFVVTRRVRATDHGVETFIDDSAFDETVEYLAAVIPETVYFLGDDRSLRSDIFREEEEEMERQHERPPFHRDRSIDSRTSALQKALGRAHQWISQRALGASAIGGMNTNAVYVDVAKRIATPTMEDDPASKVTVPELKQRLLALGRRNESFARLGLVPAAPAAELVEALEQANDEREAPMLSVLVPFADALSARLDALDEIRESLSVFLDETSRYLVGKRVDFDLRHGLRIITDEAEPLRPTDLSSGETHLLLLLTNTLYTRDEPALYLIDEPEISLNMKWQRRLVESLVACTAGSSTSFVMASHSFELMAAARERVANLGFD